MTRPILYFTWGFPRPCSTILSIWVHAMCPSLIIVDEISLPTNQFRFKRVDILVVSTIPIMGSAPKQIFPRSPWGLHQVACLWHWHWSSSQPASHTCQVSSGTIRAWYYWDPRDVKGANPTITNVALGNEWGWLPTHKDPNLVGQES